MSESNKLTVIFNKMNKVFFTCADCGRKRHIKNLKTVERSKQDTQQPNANVTVKELICRDDVECIVAKRKKTIENRRIENGTI